MIVWAPPPENPPGETPQEWARRVLTQHGPPPARLVEHVRRLRTQVGTARKRSA